MKIKMNARLFWSILIMILLSVVSRDLSYIMAAKEYDAFVGSLGGWPFYFFQASKVFGFLGFLLVLYDFFSEIIKRFLPKRS